MNCTTLGIDLAKTLFQRHGVDACGHVVVQKRVSVSGHSQGATAIRGRVVDGWASKKKKGGNSRRR